MLITIAIIHLLPIAGFGGASQLESLYGVSVNSADLELLMRHRAVLFGILGSVFAYAAFVPKYQNLAFVMTAISLLSFFYLFLETGTANAAISRVAMVDVLALICLLLAVVLRFSGKHSLD